MKNNKIRFLSTLTALSLMFTACASSDSSNTATSGGSDGSMTTEGMTGGAVMDSAMAYEASDDSYNIDFNTEEYNSIIENIFLSASLNPLSTFAADVDTASYSNIRRFLSNGEMPPPDSVRIEEMINYFNYEYAEPTNNEPFSIETEISNTPWNEDTMLLKIGIKAPEVDMSEIAPQNFVFLIDVSGSMNHSNKLPLVKRAFLLLCEQLRPQDKVSIVTYASSDTIVLNGATGDEAAVIMSAIENLESGGGTAGSKGIETAYEIASKHFVEGGNNRIILATDGDLNIGTTSEGDLTRLITEKAKSGVFLSVMGFGEDNIKDNKMEALANNGNGNYSYIDSIIEAKRVLIEEMGATLLTVAKDVKLQVEFNPNVIKGYRLIGYENRLMNAEDFNDDTKDGGEIGAGHRVTAIYEVVHVSSPFEISESDLKYSQSETNSEFTDEWATVNIRYKEPDENESQLISHVAVQNDYSEEMSDNMKLASAVAEIGMLLRASEFSGTSTYQSALELLKSTDFDDSYVRELIYFTEKLDAMN